jgi:nicotinamidase-related amidase
VRTDALIVVDVQNGFVNRHSETALDGVNRAIEHARALGIPVFFTRFINSEGSAWETLIGWSRLRTSPETDLHSSIASAVHPDEVIDKAQYSSVLGEIASLVDGGGFREIAICGIATDSCVLKTAVDLFELGVRPVVLTDAVASHAGEDVHEAGLLLIGRFIGRDQLITTAEWVRDSETVPS